MADLRRVGRPLVYAVLLLGGIGFVVPFLWMIRTSLLAVDQIFANPPQWIPDPVVWNNYRLMWETGPFTAWVRNSVVSTFFGVLGNTVTSAVVAFAFARTSFPGRDRLFLLVLATMMVPVHVTIIPQFVLFKQLGWLNTLLPIIVPELFGSAFFIFILRQFFLTLPRELDEAAEIDGAGMLTILWRIVLPLSKPAVATVAVLAFIDHWNNFFRPFIFITTPENLTLAVGIRWFTTQHGTEFHLLMAASVVAVLPIIAAFFFAQKHFVQGIVFTGMKG